MRLPNNRLGGRGKLTLALKRNVSEEHGRRCYAVSRPVPLLPRSQTPSANPLYLSALPLPLAATPCRSSVMTELPPYTQPTARYKGGKRIVAGRFEFGPRCARNGRSLISGQTRSSLAQICLAENEGSLSLSRMRSRRTIAP